MRKESKKFELVLKLQMWFCMKQKIIFIFFFILYPISHATLDVRNGSYNHTSLDFIVSNSEIDMRLQREYSSRDNRRGWFGWGWCSNYESKLVIHENEIIFKSCRFEIGFKRINKTLWKTISEPNGTIKVKKNQFILDMQDGFIYVFNNAGSLLSILDRNQKTLAFNWSPRIFSKAKVLTVRSSDHFEMQFIFNSNHIVDRVVISAPRGLVLHREEREVRPKRWTFFYQYQDDNLISFKEEAKTLVSYKYSLLRNLVEVQTRFSKTFKVQYDEEKDLVTNVTHPDGCYEDLAYWFNSTQPQNHHRVQYKKVCDKAVIVFGIYEFIYNIHPSTGRYLNTLIVNKGGRVQTINFSPITGYPIERSVSNYE